MIPRRMWEGFFTPSRVKAELEREICGGGGGGLLREKYMTNKVFEY